MGCLAKGLSDRMTVLFDPQVDLSVSESGGTATLEMKDSSPEESK